MPQRSRKRTHARIAAVLTAPAIALTLMAPCASAATPADAPAKCKETAHMSRMAAPCHSAGGHKDTPTKCQETTHVSLLGHKTCLTPSKDEDSSSDGLLGLGSLLGVVTGLLGGLLGGLGGG
jgi:hypothetical protein